MNAIERGARAKELLESQTFKELHESIRNDLIARIETVAFEDIDAQHELVLMLQLHKQQRTRLQRWIDDATLEKKSEDQKNWIEKARQKFRA